MQYIKSLNHKKIFPEKQIFKNIDFLLVLSKLVDSKINNLKLKFRSKNNHILIEEIASVLASSILYSNNTDVFFKYKKFANEFSIKQKEHKYFKFLLAKNMLECIFKIEMELFEISKSIELGKTINKIFHSNKKIIDDSVIYSISKFNKNSTKLIYFSQKNDKVCTKNLFNELFEAELKLKIYINYLLAMFN